MKLKPSNIILLNAGLSKHYADWNFEKIQSPFARIYYITKGTGTVYFGTGPVKLKTNHLYLIPPYTLHTDECSGSLSLYYIHLYETVSDFANFFEQFYFPVETKALSIDRALIKRLLDINPNRELQKYDPKSYDNPQTLLNTIAISESTPLAESLETQSILFQLLSRFVRNALPKYSSTDKRIINSLEYISQNIDKSFSIHTLAEKCCLSLDHFVRLFKKETHQTPLTYINAKKIEKAQFLLVFSNKQIKEIALQLSFENISYFNRVFKKYTRQTPQDYRQTRLTT
jgi:AraC-like DNA-binding protein